MLGVEVLLEVISVGDRQPACRADEFDGSSLSLQVGASASRFLELFSVLLPVQKSQWGAKKIKHVRLTEIEPFGVLVPF